MKCVISAAIFFVSLQLVISQCPQNCQSCSDINQCSSCKVGYWGSHFGCVSKCSNNCTNSNCDNDGYCYTCVNDTYGPYCMEDCQLCKNGKCGLRECTSGCKTGYFQYVSGNNSYCYKCQDICQQCQNYTYCNLCDAGYYIFKYTLTAEPKRDVATCSSCQSNNVCDQCSQLPNCLQCSYSNGSLACEHCVKGYMLNNNQCVKNIPCGINNYCLNGCSSNGGCNGCTDGRTGNECNYGCGEMCSKCPQFDQILCEACKDGFYTSKCDISCPQNCATRQCDFNNGSCLNGCLSGFWGDKCEDSCSDHCSQSECNRDGTCSHGCTAAYSGLYCNITTTTTTVTTVSTLFKTPGSVTGNESTTSSLTTIISSTKFPEEKTLKNEQADSQLPVAAIGGGAGGGVVFVTVVVVIICIVKRRKQNKKELQDNLGIVVSRDEASNPVFDPEINNAESTYPTSKQPVDYIYAQPNKPKKQSINTASSEGPNDMAYSSIEIDMNGKDAGEETDTDETVELEDLDDGEADVIAAAEAEAPSTDTYYNTEGLKRSRIQVSKLLDYIQGKSDFQSEFERLPKKLTRSCNEALKPQNRAKNRYNGVYSYDATRVVLRSKEYINASHIEGYNNSKAYIASLGPTKSTMPEFVVFWEMVWQEKTQKIVMLTNLMETGKMKCEQYWPDNGSSRQYGSISVTAKAEHVYAEFVVRELHVLKGGESRTVTQYHYTAWPDKSVPDTVVSLVEFRDIVEKKRTPNAGPMVVHCSAGIGRTGTYIALDTLIKEGKAENSVDIFGCVNALRGQRVHMVQNVEQYVFLHHCVVYALTCLPGPLDVSSLTSYTRDDNMNDQFQALMNLPPLANKESDSISTNTKRKENRKGSDIPGNLHRVKQSGTKKDYINAVFVDGYLQENRYILAQTPMPSTLDDFVSMLYQQKVGLVVSLDEDDGKDKTLGQYVAPANKVSKIGHFTVSTVSCESSEDFVVRALKISNIGQSNANDLNIRQYHFRGWKNTRSVPESLQAFMSLITVVNKHCRPEKGTILFHCLDGATKSGLMCAVAIMLEKLAVERELSVINTICHVRGRRRKALQEFDQFKFCYNCVREHLETSEAKAYYNIL